MYAKASDGTKIHYKIKKRGEQTILILSQIGLNLTALEPLADSFAGDFTIIFLELRNHGKSGKGKVSIKGFMKDIEAVVKNEKIKDLFILGACFNNPLVVEFAHRFPTKVKGIILCNLTIKEFANLKIRACFSILRLFESLLRLLSAFHTNKKRYIDMKDVQLRGIIHSIYIVHKMTSVKVFLRTLDLLQKYDLLQRINSLSIPALIYQEEKSEYGGMNILRNINNKKLTKITGINHIPTDKELKDFRSFIFRNSQS